MLENPLANFFGGNKPAEKERGGALTNGMDALLKDAPLPVKVLGGLMKPLVKGLENALEQQAEATDALISEAGSCLRADPRVTELLGEDVEIGGVFSSASSNINGAQSINLQAQCAGRIASGVVAIRGQTGADGQLGIASLQVQAGGRVIDVPTIRGGGSGMGSGGGGMGGGMGGDMGGGMSGGMGGGGGASRGASGSDVVIDV